MLIPALLLLIFAYNFTADIQSFMSIFKSGILAKRLIEAIPYLLRYWQWIELKN